jgi:Tfp pilus assembly protein PilZ
MAVKSKAKKTTSTSSTKKSSTKAASKLKTKGKAVAKKIKAASKASAKSSVKVKTAKVATSKTSTKSAAKVETKVEAKVKAVAAPKVDDKKTKRRNAATEALEAALAESDSNTADEEFDPAAFFGGAENMGDFRPHVMRKERVDLAITVRYRTKGPLVHNAELLNLSKGGLCLKTPETIKAASEVRVEIPLPHTSELFAVLAEVVWSDHVEDPNSGDKPIHTGLRFKPMSLAKQTVINQFIQQRRDEVIMAKIGLDKFTDSVPVAGLD